MSRRQIIGVLAAALLGGTAGISLLPTAATGATSTAVTKKVDDGPFKGLAVTVSKTQSLVNEVVTISWTGGKPTIPAGRPNLNFMQIMQCWGDAATGPTPEQCQFGASAPQDSNPFLGSRQVMFPDSYTTPRDPLEHRDRDDSGAGYIPFEAANGTKVGGKFGDITVFFDVSGTNEITRVPTRSDGAGEEFVEIQTANEAPGLGCGQIVNPGGSAPKGRSCWLVVVPRSDTEVDGTVYHDDSPTQRVLQTSPLSATNWAHRIVFPLTFQPLGGSCPLNAEQIPVFGDENVTEAVTRWQPSLCAATKSVFSFAQLSDDAARGVAMSSDPGLSIVTKPLANSSGKVYAPVAVSGFGFAYNLETRAPSDAPKEVAERNGARITDLKLTPRLVAKLLTQSYRGGLLDPGVLNEHNPYRMEDDPEFRAINPQFAQINQIPSSSLWTIITPLTPSDATELVWEWINSDAEARDFLAGKPDPNGMVINPAWNGMAFPRSDFPKPDQTCREKVPPATIDQCVPDAYPYAGDAHQAVLGATKGDTLAKTVWDQTANPPAYKSADRQVRGVRGIMVVSDTATASRYNLPLAQLRNANGKFVSPTSASLLAAVAKFKSSSVPGVLTSNPAVKDDSAYPLTTVSYAVTTPAGLTSAQRTVYAGFISYAVGTGQIPGVEPGSLPDGYAPMPKAMKDAASTVVKAIKNFKAPTPKPTPKAATPKPTTKPSNSGSSGGTGTATPTPAPSTAVEPTPLPSTTPVDLPTGPITPTDSTQNVSAVTPASPVGESRHLFLWVLAAAAVALVGGRTLPLLWTPSPATARPSSPRIDAQTPGQQSPGPNDETSRGGGAGARP